MDLNRYVVIVKRVARAGFLSFWRNWFVTLSSVLVMTVTLFVVGTLAFTGVILNASLQQLREKVDVNVYFVTSASEEDILAVKRSLEALPEVAKVEYVSRKAAIAAFRERHKNDQLTLQALDELGENPLGAVLNIRAKDTREYESIAKFFDSPAALSREGATIVDKVNFFEESHRAAIERLNTIITAGERIGFAVILIFAATTVMIMFNTIRLAIYTAREEIGVMRLVGASAMYIRGPFMFEGTMYGLSAALVTLILFYPLTLWLGNATADFFGGVNIFYYYLSHFALFFLLIAGTGVLLGGLSSYLAVRRYLKI